MSLQMLGGFPIKPPVNMYPDSLKLQDLLAAIKADHTLSDDQKAKVLAKVHDEEFLTKFLASASGAVVGYAIAKFLKMETKGKILLSLAGFGVGRLLYNAFFHDETKKRVEQSSQVETIR